jgi:serine/threonine protein kinase
MDKPYSNKSDIWSLGCVLYEAVVLKPPFRSDSMEGLFKKVLNGLYPAIPKHYSKDIGYVISKMLNVNSAKRPSCEELLQNQVIQKRINELVDTEIPMPEDALLDTIRCPKNLLFLTD